MIPSALIHDSGEGSVSCGALDGSEWPDLNQSGSGLPPRSLLRCLTRSDREHDALQQSACQEHSTPRPLERHVSGIVPVAFRAVSITKENRANRVPRFVAEP